MGVYEMCNHFTHRFIGCLPVAGTSNGCSEIGHGRQKCSGAIGGLCRARYVTFQWAAAKRKMP